MSTTQTHTETLAIINCANCSILFGIPKHYQQARREDHAAFHCPNGHSNVYRADENDRLRRELARAESEAQHQKMMRGFAEERAEGARKQADRERMGRLGERSAKVKLQKRINNGMCPCCRRSFRGLAEHMRKMHPEFVDDAASETEPAAPAPAAPALDHRKGRRRTPEQRKRMSDAAKRSWANRSRQK